MITYKKQDARHIRVYLEKKWIGEIIMTMQGTYFYSPRKSNNPCDIFLTLEACKQSLEAP